MKYGSVRSAQALRTDLAKPRFENSNLKINNMVYIKINMPKFQNKDFVFLHTHSHFSLLDGLGKPEKIIERAKSYGCEAVAIADHGAMYGAIDFYKEAKSAGIKPVIGVEAYIAPRTLKDKSTKQDGSPYHLCLFAKDLDGYRNLMKLVSIAHLQGYYYKPRIDKKTLKKYAKGLIGSSACLVGEIPRHILSKDYEGAKKALLEYQDIFGKDDFYLEIQDHPQIPEQKVANDGVIKLAGETGAALIVTCDSHYVDKEDREAHDVLVCVQTGRTVDDEKRMIYSGDFSLRDPQELAKAFAKTPEALTNTKKLADKCNLEIPFAENLLPQYKLPKGETPDSRLRQMCEEGIKARYGKLTAEQKKSLEERLTYELETISKMGFASYFLIVADYTKWAKQQGIMVGPGRGSAAGALVAYLTEITNVDPIRYGLLFERFLNPDRLEMPDIDLDFADHRRSEVLDYVTKKYGQDKVAGIITFGTMAARAAVRDTGRALGMAYADVDAIAKVVPPPVQGRHIPLEKSVQDAPELKQKYDSDAKAKRLLDMAIKLEGTVRHASQHASAFVITEKELPFYVPLQEAQKEGVEQITQYSMYPVAELGLLKMDFLGLSNLTTIERTLEIVEAVYSKKIDIFNLPLEDKKTFELLGKAETTGVFQLESSGMKRYIKELKPTSVDDVAVMVALYRPGPLQFIDSFIKRRQGKEEINYPHEMTKNALEPTYGIPVYQEQVMQVAKDMAHFTGGEADKLRKAMGKKIVKLMAEMKEKFIKGAQESGASAKDAQEVFAMLEDFAAYGFNKSHAVCYAMIAYQTAYLKAHYPECFMAALMTSDLGDIDRLAIEISDAERMGIEVMPPDINESFVDFGVVKETKNIRFGLAAIKGIGEVPARVIVRERKKNGPFKSLEDFVDRVTKTDVEGSGERTILNKKVLESLAKSGGLDNMGERQAIISGMDVITERIKETNKDKKSAQIGLFGEVISGDIELGELKLPEVAPAEKSQRLAWEKELLGIYLSEHPLKEIGANLKKFATHEISGLNLQMEGKRIKICGIVVAVKKINTRSGEPMMFVTVEDLSGKAEVLVFPKLLKEDGDIWQNDSVVSISGKISTKDGEVKILADKVDKYDPEKAKKMPDAPRAREETIVTVSDEDEIVEIDLQEEPEAVSLSEELLKADEGGRGYLESRGQFVVILKKNTKKDDLVKLKDMFLQHKGEVPVLLAHRQNGSFETVKTSVTVKVSDKLKAELGKIIL